MARAFLVLLVTAVAAGIWTAKQAPAGLLPSPRRPYQSYGSPQVRTAPLFLVILLKRLRGEAR